MVRQHSKVVSLSEAVSQIHDGANLSLSGFGQSLAPLAFVRELIKQGKGDFELSAVGEAWAVDMLCAAKRVKKIRMSNFMFEGFGRCPNFSKAVENGEVEVEDYSHYGMTARLSAAALGLPSMPVRTMMGSDIEKISGFEQPKFHHVTCPFTGEKTLLLPALHPDFTIIHASCADQNGNVQLYGHGSIIEEQARAGKCVIVTVEKIVPEQLVRRNPERTILPSFLVDMVVEVPFGAHPAGMYQAYDYDEAHIREYLSASKDPEQLNQYLDRYVYGVSNHMEYLDLIGISKLMELRADPEFGYSLKSRGELE